MVLIEKTLRAVTFRGTALDDAAHDPDGIIGRMKRLLIGALLLSLAMPPALFADGLPDLGESSQVELSPFAERSIGQDVMNDIRLHEPTYLDDPEVAAYLNELGHRLTAQVDSDSRQDFEFFALNDPTVNAFAMPGGFIGVHTGLILLAQSESELAAVLAHEISHVTQHHMARQLRPQGQSQMIALLSMAAALIAARNRPDLAQGAIMAGQGAAISTQLSYSRDFEREADRLGINLLERAGFDIRAMETFFGRMQQNYRLYEANAQSYLMTHPLTTERMADMANRIQQRPYHQAVDSPTFWLVRAKIAATTTPSVQDTIASFRSQLQVKKFGNESAAHYGLAIALERNRDYKGAEAELQVARKGGLATPMFETLAADLKLRQGDTAGAIATLKAAYAKYPASRAVVYMLIDDLINDGKPREALDITKRELKSYSSDYKLYEFAARSHAALGHVLAQHRSQAEAYANTGQYPAAIEQLMIAQKAPDGDFYERSQVDARLRELRQVEADKQREKGSESRDNFRGEMANEF